jgi:hypothetical protein
LLAGDGSARTGEVRVRGDDQQGIKLLALREGQIMGQETPDAVASPVTDAGDIAGQHGHAGEHNLLADELGHGPLKQDAGPLGAEPGTGKAPAHEAPATLGIAVVHVGSAAGCPRYGARACARRGSGRGDRWA